MPSREAIANTMLPQDVPRPIPVRSVTTRTAPKAAPQVVSAQQNQNQPTTVGASPAAAPATGEETLRLSPAASVLARKEQAFRQREQAFKAREQEFTTLREKAEKYEQLTQKLSVKDYSEAEKLGLNYEEYVKYKLNEVDGEDPNAQRIAELERQLSDLKKGQEESVDQAYEATVTEYRKEISQLLASNPEFASLKNYGKKAEEWAVQLVIDSWEEDDVELTAEKALKDVKNELFAIKKEFDALSDGATAQEQVAHLPPPQRPSVNTLTNQMQPPSGEPKHQKSLQFLSENERYAEARRRVLARRAQQT